MKPLRRHHPALTLSQLAFWCVLLAHICCAPSTSASVEATTDKVQKSVAVDSMSADELWNCIQKLNSKDDLKAIVDDPNLNRDAKLARLNEIQTFRETHLQTAIAELLKKYPNDVRRWDAKIIRTEFVMDGYAQSKDEIISVLQEVKEASDATHESKRLAERLLLRYFPKATKGIAPVDIKQPFELKFTALNGESIDLAKLRGSVILLDFWATWCVPCMEKLPEIRELSHRYADAGLKVIGVSLDDNRSALKRAISSEKLSWPEYFDDKGWDGELVKQLQVTSIPAAFLVDKDGVIHSVGREVDLEAEIRKLLKAPAQKR